jgi:hypothetical protein
LCAQRQFWFSTAWEEKKMNNAQKFAWSNLIIIAITLTLSGVTTLLFTSYHGIPLMGLLGFLGVSSAVFRKKRRQDGKNFDERDRLIYERSLTAAHSVFWPFFVAACMLPWLVFRSSGSTPVYVLPMILGGGGVVAVVVQSIAIIVQYGWGVKDGEK